MGKVGPFFGILHHLLATGGVVIVHRDFRADVLLCDSERLLHAEFHGKTMGVPSGLALYMETLHRLVAAHYILDCASHDMVDPRHSVGRWRTFVKDKRRTALAFLHRTDEKVVGIPISKHLFIDVGKIQLLAVFLEFFIHKGIRVLS